MVLLSMMKKLIKKEYEVLYLISRVGQTNLERLGDNKETLEIIKKLEKLGLIKIETRDKQIYGFMETKKGEKLLTSKEYEDWFNDCGDWFWYTKT